MDEFALLDERRMREKIVNIGDCLMGMSGDRTLAGSVEAILFIMPGVRAVKMMRQAQLHQDQKQREKQHQFFVGPRKHVTTP